LCFPPSVAIRMGSGTPKKGEEERVRKRQGVDAYVGGEFPNVVGGKPSLGRKRGSRGSIAEAVCAREEVYWRGELQKTKGTTVIGDGNRHLLDRRTIQEIGEKNRGREGERCIRAK